LGYITLSIVQGLDARFPTTSNVVLTVRNTESWFKSWHDSLAQSLQLIHHPVYKQLMTLMKKSHLAIFSNK
jgi:hypothetical protein